jgi:hypothetical protein
VVTRHQQVEVPVAVDVPEVGAARVTVPTGIVLSGARSNTASPRLS